MMIHKLFNKSSYMPFHIIVASMKKKMGSNPNQTCCWMILFEYFFDYFLMNLLSLFSFSFSLSLALTLSCQALCNRDEDQLQCFKRIPRGYEAFSSAFLQANLKSVLKSLGLPKKVIKSSNTLNIRTDKLPIITLHPKSASTHKKNWK